MIRGIRMIRGVRRVRMIRRIVGKELQKMQIIL
jgi:hypothetical protein